MQPPHLFSVPLTTTQKKHTFRAAHSTLSGNKRKRGFEDIEDPPSHKEQHLSNSATARRRAHALSARPESGSVAPVLTPDEIYQYKIAGQPLDKPLPEGHFAHAPPPADPETCPGTDDTTSVEGDRRNKRHATIDSPNLEIVKNAARPTRNLRHQHLAVVTAIVHRCLLQGDFQRAGRAMGLLLRSEIGKGEYFDIRADGRWGIGAEILLRRGESGGNSLNSSHSSTDEGFEAAKDYYERLILQYPYRKSHPHAVSAIHFYPAMFSLWIYQVQCRSKRAREQLQRLGSPKERSPDSAHGELNQAIDAEEEHADADEESGRNDRKGREGEIRVTELRQALEIAARMDQLMVSPPYDKNVPLLKFRGMVALWIGDLRVAEAEYESGRFDASPSADEPDASMDRILARRRYEGSLVERQKDVNRARICFRRVIGEGGELWDELRYLVDRAGGEQREQTPERHIQ